MRVALCTFFGAQRHSHDIPPAPGRGCGAGVVTPGADVPEDHRGMRRIEPQPARRAPGPMPDLGNTALGTDPPRRPFPPRSFEAWTNVSYIRERIDAGCRKWRARRGGQAE